MNLSIRLTPWRIVVLALALFVLLTLSRGVWLPLLTAVGSEVQHAREDYNQAHTDALNAARSRPMAVAPTAVAQERVTPVLNLPTVETDEQRAARKLAAMAAERDHVRSVPEAAEH